MPNPVIKVPSFSSNHLTSGSSEQMQSNQPGLNSLNDGNPDDPTSIPALVRAWGSDPQVSSVRRPSELPDPQSYHEAIEPEAIFEVRQVQADGSIEALLVVPFGCQRCRSFKQACSRTRPACVRCRKAGEGCDVIRGGYQRLPGPKFKRPWALGGRKRDESEAATSAMATPEPAVGRNRARAKRIVSSGSKRPLSPGSDSVPPRKKTQAKTRVNARKGKARRFQAVLSSDEDMDTEYSEGSVEDSLVRVEPTEPAVVASAAEERDTARWTFVDGSRVRDKRTSWVQEPMHSAEPSSTRVPRVWTRSLDGFLTVFPQLAKTTAGFSWFQSETPILLLDTNYTRGHWINSTTLSIDLLWDFSCRDSELEDIADSNIGGDAESHPCQSMVHSPENALDRDTEMMDIQRSSSPPGLFSIHPAVPAPTSTAQIPPLDCSPQRERDTDESHARGESPIENKIADDQESICLLYPSSPLSPEESLLSDPIPNGSHTCQVNLQPRIPLSKPPEVETLRNCQLRFIPILLWISHDSTLVPCNLPPEYSYSSMGLFFISDLRHAIPQYEIPSVPGIMQGQVCWSITLQWAPGGEDALLDSESIPSSSMSSGPAPLCVTRDPAHPWWLDSADTLLAESTTLYRPRDLRTQIFSCVPLDLIGEFHPSEVFPRGWFCKSCGMINIQEFFRHQICQSSACGSRHEKGVPPGKADPLFCLRDAHKSSALVQPTNKVPAVAFCDRALWDDGMQSWSYGIKDGVTVCHVFTGNQEHLQDDATNLLECVQRDVLLRKEDRSSPYFVHTTRLSSPHDGSETMVPEGTPDCIRIAYHTLCDLVHRYGEMEKPRFGKVRLQAWVNSGSKKAGVLRASKSPVVVYCLGSEVVLNLTPKGGYTDVGESAPDKGKARADDEVPMESRAGPLHHAEPDLASRALIIASTEPEVNELPIGLEDAPGSTEATNAVHQNHGSDVNGVAIIDSDPSRFGSGTEAACQEAAEPKQGHVHKKDRINKDKSKGQISITLVHGDCVVLCGDDFECQIVRFGTTILVIGFPEET